MIKYSVEPNLYKFNQIWAINCEDQANELSNYLNNSRIIQTAK